MLVAVLFSIAALCSLMSSVLMAERGNKSTGLMMFQLFTMGLLILCSILNWVVYFKKYVAFEVKNQSGEEADKEQEDI